MLKKTFIRGTMNLDADNRLLLDGEHREATNIEVINSEGSDIGAIENSLSNKKLTNIDLGANPKTLGKFEDEAEDKIYWWIKSDTGTFLLEYDAINAVSSIVLKDTRTEDVGRVLNLKEGYLITGVAKVISEDTKEDLLIWTDDNIEICCINIERAKQWDENNFEAEDIYLIKKQPKYAPGVIPTYSAEESNYLEELFLSFATRYKYRDGERSAISSYSNYNFNPKKFEMDYQSMENIGMVNAFNAVRITIDTGPKQVTDIEIISKASNSIALYLATSFNKQKEGWGDNEQKDYVFSNNKIYEILAEKELYRTFDNVPRKAKALDIIENILVVGNYLEGYPLKDISGKEIKIDFTLGIESNDVTGEELITAINVAKDEITIAFPGSINLKKGNRLIFELKLDEPTYSGNYGNSIEYILTNDFASPLFLSQDTDFQFFIGTILTNRFLVDFDITIDGSTTLTGNVPFSIIGASSTSITIKAIVLNYTVDNTPLDPNDNPANTSPQSVPFFFSDNTLITYNTLESFASCKTRMDYEAGVLYQDHWSRKTTVLPSASNTIFIPQKLSVFQNKLLVNINSKPPYWAESYKMVIKAQPLQYQIIYATVYYPEGVYRWVKLEGSNRDKVKEGDTLVVKSDLGGPLLNPIKTRVLELGLKDKDFIENNLDLDGNPIIEESGLYMKIKPRGYDMSYTENAIINVDEIRSAGKNRQEKFQQAAMLEGFFGDQNKVNTWKNTTINNDLKKPAIAVSVFNNFDVTDIFESKLQIIAGSKLNFYFRVYEDGVGTQGEFKKDFIAASTHADIKAWWSEEVVDLGSESDNFYINFEENVSGEIRILVQGNNTGSASNAKQSKLVVRIDVILVEGLVIFETEPKQAENVIFYETEQTFDIVNGEHQGNIQNQNNGANAPAIINLDFFNCYVQGNGVESYRVKDAFNTNFLNIDLKPTTTKVEQYDEIRRFADLTYSEGYIESTNQNGLNVFNASQANFKELDKKYNSVQLIKNRETNLAILQEDKASYVLFGKDLLSMANGDTVLAVIPEILGRQQTYGGENGIGKSPESAAFDSFRIYYVNARRGTPIRLSMDGTSEINYGLIAFFRSLFILNPNSEKLGCWDPYHQRYVLSTEDEALPVYNAYCGNSIYKDLTAPFQYILNLNDLKGDIVLNYNIIGGNATIDAIFDASSNVVSNVTGLGSITINRTNLSEDKVYVTITPIGASASVEITNNCPIGTQMSITSVVLNDQNIVGQTITNRFKINGTPYSDNHFFGTSEVSKFYVETGLEGVGKFPTTGDSIVVEAFKDVINSADFLTSKFNEIGYLVTDQVYTDADVNTIQSLATFLTISEVQVSLNSYTKGGSFVFTRPTDNHNLYLVWDYRDHSLDAVNDSIEVLQGRVSDINVLQNDSYNDPVTVTIITPPINGTAAVQPNGIIRYTHNNTTTTLDSITYQIDSAYTSDTATVSIAIILDTNPRGGGGGGAEGVVFNTSFIGDSNVAENACSFNLNTTRYHNGNNTYPTLADTIYTDIGKTTVFAGALRYYNTGFGRSIQIDNSGVVQDVWICGAGNA
jgi:hypothetical protein